MKWCVSLIVSVLHSAVAGLISSGGDHGLHYWWDLISSKQQSSISIRRAQVFTGFSSHGNLIHNIIPLLKKENEYHWIILVIFLLGLVIPKVYKNENFYRRKTLKEWAKFHQDWNYSVCQTKYCASMFNNGPGDRSLIPGWVILKIQNMVLDTALLNTHHKVRIKGKVAQYKGWDSALCCNSY